MSLADHIRPELPYLRRFARALCGTQEGGDAYVVSTLEALVADPDSFEASPSPRVTLYRVFLKIWNGIAVNAAAEPAASEGEAKLERLTPKSRQAFLLTAVEGFSAEEAAQVMDVDQTTFAAHLGQAAVEMSEQVLTDVLIIEDEPIIAMDLEALVESLGHRVTDIARTHREALAAVGKLQPGLVLADIQLADGSSGLDAVNDILQSFEVPVIFITAYPERLLTGQRPEPAFLITKPFQTDTLKAMISQALFFGHKARRRDAA